MPLLPIHGHVAIRQRLDDAIRRDALPGSILLHGPLGVGKQRLALWLGQRLLCTGPEPKPCSACQHCRYALAGTHPDIHWYFPRPRLKDSDISTADIEDDFREAIEDRLKSGAYAPPAPADAIFVATIRAMVSSAALAPALGSRKVYILGDAERMVVQEGAEDAAGAFLKLLEEPPPRATIILTSSEPGALIPTIRSRVVALRVPAQGQAAYVLGAGVHVGPGTHIAPIASMAKVMTAYLVLHRFPLGGARRGVMLTVTARDVADRNRRVSRGESTVPVRAGERLSERQALAALLLPSANNVAIMLARRVSSSVTAFVARMNRTARSLGMRHTRYTDPSGFDARTRSTASDQLRLALAAMRLPVVRALVVRRSYRIPVAGTVHTTDALLGHDGFVGIKTGSMSASGGCFMFRSYRVVRGRTVAMTGVVMGQYGGDLIQAGLAGARRLVDRVAPTPWRL